MSDATNSNKRDLWLYDDGSWREGFHDDGKVSPLLHFIARPAADDEALLRALLKSSLDAGAWKARAERAEAATREADARANTATVACDLMRARAEKAEAALDAEKAARIAEVAEFNAGYAAYMAKKPLAEAEAEYVASLPVTPEGYTPVSPPYDVFGFGYAWAAWDDLRCELKKAEAERDELRARLDAARGGAS